MEGEQRRPGSRGRSRRQTRESRDSAGKALRIKILAGVGAGILLVGGIAGFSYIRQAKKYETVFFPNTVINDIDVSDKSVYQVKSEISSGIEGYRLLIKARDGKTGEISGEAIGLHSEFDGSLEKYLEEQDTMKWAFRGGETSSYEIETMIAFDEEILSSELSAMEFMDPEAMTAPEDAHISDYDSSIKGYTVVPEVQGTTLDPVKTAEAVKAAVMGLKTELDLEEAGCYESPEILSDDAGLNALCGTLNTYTGAVINYTFGDKTEVLSGDTIHNWLTVDGTSVSIDSAKAAEYVKNLASKYDTAYKPKALKTSYGKTVTIKTGNYGWRINQEKETAAVLEIVKAGEQRTREPEYSQKAASHGANDYGNTYVEINLTAQHLFFYKDGKLLVETVVLLTQKRKSKDYKVEIEIPIDVDGSKTYTEEKSTYQNIKKFIKAKYGVNTHTKDIAEVKRDCGVEMRLNYNISKKENPKIRHCTQEKRGYIMDALEYYQVI